jgi:DMSO/TMAO reductase YedYZ molybdopterin-dependent catalytic subunit
MPLALALSTFLLVACGATTTPTIAPSAAPSTAPTSVPTVVAATATTARPAAPSTAGQAGGPVAASPTVPSGAAAATASSRAGATRTVALGDDQVLLTGLVERAGPLSVAALRQLPNETAQVSFLSGNNTEQHTYVGVRLVTVLNNAKLKTNDKYKNDKLRKYIVFTAKDGYEATVAWGEIDPDFGNAAILLAWEEDGKPLTGASGPLRLVVPTDKRGGRYVSGVVTIDVRDPDSPAR